jgi:phosphoribosylaminoimidazole carboxylase (NCAIR synthetase)
MIDVENEILERVNVFVADLTALLRQAALETASEAISNAGINVTRRGGGAGRGRSAGARSAKASAPVVAKRAKGQKRSAEELEQLTSTLAAYVKKNAGQRAEQIAEGLGLTTKDLQLPFKKLIAAGALKTKGQKRSTRYFPR